MKKLTMYECCKKRLDETYLVVYVNVNMKCHKNIIIKMSQFLIYYNYIY